MPRIKDLINSLLSSLAIEAIERLEDEGRILVIRPIRPVEVSRMEKNTAKLTALYQEGYDIANAIFAGLKLRV